MIHDIINDMCKLDPAKDARSLMVKIWSESFGEKRAIEVNEEYNDDDDDDFSVEEEEEGYFSQIYVQDSSEEENVLQEEEEQKEEQEEEEIEIINRIRVGKNHAFEISINPRPKISAEQVHILSFEETAREIDVLRKNMSANMVMLNALVDRQTKIIDSSAGSKRPWI